MADTIGGLMQFITETVNELAVDVKGIASSTVDTTILSELVNIELIADVNVPVVLPKLNGEFDEYNVPFEKYRV